MHNKTGKYIHTCCHENVEYKTDRHVKSFCLLFPSGAGLELHSVRINISQGTKQ